MAARSHSNGASSYKSLDFSDVWDGHPPALPRFRRIYNKAEVWAVPGQGLPLPVLGAKTLGQEPAPWANELDTKVRRARGA